MKLYSLPHSPFSGRVRMQIYFKNLPIEILNPPGFKTPEYEAINPIGKVPALELDDGTTLPESAVIIQYLEDVFPDNPLFPTDPKQKAVTHLLGSFTDSYMQPPMYALFGQVFNRTADDEAMQTLIENMRAPLKVFDGLLNRYDRGGHNKVDYSDVMFAPYMYFAEYLPKYFGEDDILKDCDLLKAIWDWHHVEPSSAKVIEEIDVGLEAFLTKIGIK